MNYVLWQIHCVQTSGEEQQTKSSTQPQDAVVEGTDFHLEENVKVCSSAYINGLYIKF